MRLLLALLVCAQPAGAVSVERLPEVRVQPAIPAGRFVPFLELPASAGPGASLAPELEVPALLPAAVEAAPLPVLPSAAAAEPVAVQPQAPLTERLAPISAAVEADVQTLGRASGEAASGGAQAEIRLLQGGEGAAPASIEAAPAAGRPASLKPAPAPEERRRAVRYMMWGTPAFKLGAEVVTLSMPLLVMKNLGGATMVAALVVVYQAAQAAVGALTPALLRRWPAARILAGSILAQGVLVGAMLGLAAAHAAAPWLVFPIYGLIGGAIGVADTARRLIPSLLLGRDEQALRDYNARLHRRYETAGVIGSALGGALIAWLGPLYAMLIQPPAYFVSAWLFLKVRHPAAPAAEGGQRASWKDVFAGARTVLGDGRLRWLAAAMVLPQIIHRVFENLLLPVYAKTLLGAGALAAALLTASNLGELGGASFMLRRSTRYPGPSAWVRWAALGLLAGWMLPLAGHWTLALALGALLPAIFLFSSTWAGSQLSLESEVQRSVPEKDQPGVMSFLNGLFIAGTAAVSFGLGRLLDGWGTGPALVWICGGFTAVGVLLAFAWRRFRPRP